MKNRTHHPRRSIRLSEAESPDQSRVHFPEEDRFYFARSDSGLPGPSAEKDPHERMPRRSNKPFHVVVAEDDEDDYEICVDVFSAHFPFIALTRFTNGEDLCRYLFDPSRPVPGLLMLDLNMPAKDGREALAEIRADSRFANVPIVVLTTSGSPADEAFVSRFPRTLFVTKPMAYLAYMQLLKDIAARYTCEPDTQN